MFCTVIRVPGKLTVYQRLSLEITLWAHIYLYKWLIVDVFATASEPSRGFHQCHSIAKYNSMGHGFRPSSY